MGLVLQFHALPFREFFICLLQFQGFCLLIIVTVVAAGSSEATSSSSSTLGLGNGLLEIAALTTLLGSSTAEILALGNRGAAGLPWASMSAFGSLSVIRTCITGASPNWLRETLGTRSSSSDLSLGMSLDLVRNLRGASRIKRSTMEAIGVSCSNLERSSARLIRPSSPPLWRDIYILDRHIHALLESIPISVPGYLPRIVTYDFDYEEPWTFTINIYDWIALLASSIKLFETYIIWRLEGFTLCWICSLTWLYFFLAAIVLQFRHSLQMWGRHSVENIGNTELDILVGQLPTTMRSGGDRKIFLGASDSDQHSIPWKIMWSLGAVVCGISLVTTYFYLGRADNQTVYLWLLFQGVWLLARLIFHHFADSVNLTLHRMVTERPWTSLPSSTKLRVLELTLALAKYQIHLHPRGHYSYKEDLLSSHALLDVLTQTDFQFGPGDFLKNATQGSEPIDVSVIAVIGDTLLSSASWVARGKTLRGIDFYDSCVVIIKNQNSHFAIPSVRALAFQDSHGSKPDLESPRPPQLAPKGATNLGWGLSWWYWIPLGKGRWLQMHTEDMKILGARKAFLLSDDEVTRKLLVGNLKISLTDVKELKMTVDVAMEAALVLLDLLPHF